MVGLVRIGEQGYQPFLNPKPHLKTSVPAAPVAPVAALRNAAWSSEARLRLQPHPKPHLLLEYNAHINASWDPCVQGYGAKGQQRCKQ